MAQATGRKAQLLLDYESSFLTPPGSPAAVKMPFISVDLSATRPKSPSTVVRNSRSPAQPFSGRLDVSGNIVVPVDVLTFGYWLKAIFGPPTTTGAEAPYTHVFKLGDTQPSLILDKGFTDQMLFYRYGGSKVGSMSLSEGDEGQLQATLGIVGASETKGTSAYDATPTEPSLVLFEHKHATLQEAGVDFDPGKTFKLDLNLSLDNAQYGINDFGIRRAIPEGVAAVSGSMSSIFDSTSAALIDKASADTKTTLGLTYANGDDSLAFYLPEVLFTYKTPAIPGPQGINLDLDFQAFYDTNVAASAVVVTLINSQASYA